MTQLWFLRLSSLARMRLYNQTAAELHNLFTTLSSPANNLTPFQQSHLLSHVLPFELEVLRARCVYWTAAAAAAEAEGASGDGATDVNAVKGLEYVDALVRLLRGCRACARAAQEERREEE